MGLHLSTLFRLFRPHAKPTPPLGARGEALAAHYTHATLGFQVLATNVRCPHGELDIVALDHNTLVFIEVRTRSSEDFGTPESTIRSKKCQALLRSAHWFTHSRRLHRFRIRIDVIAIIHPPTGTPTIRYHKNALSSP
jgi:putative endonuclease